MQLTTYDNKDIFDNNLNLRFQTKFLTLIFSIGISIVFSIAHTSLKGLKSDFDRFFPNMIEEILVLNQFENQYMVELLDVIYKKSNGKEIPQYIHQKSQILWKSYKDIEKASREYSNVFAIMRDIYQRLFLTSAYNRMNHLEQNKQNLIKSVEENIRLTNNPDSQSIEALFVNVNNIASLINTIAELKTQIGIIDKQTTDNFHSATVGMLWLSTMLTFTTVVSLSFVILAFAKRFNLYLKKLFDDATRELRILNNNLNKEIKKQIRIIREKDEIMYSQAKFVAMGEMIQNIAHQWKQPLNSIALVIQSLKNKFDMGLLTKDFVNSQTKLALDISRNMGNTIDNFRNFFRMKGELSSFNVQEIIKYVLSLNQPVLDSLRIKVNVTYKEFNGNDIVKNGDALVQIFMVLLNNSKDAFIEQKVNNAQCFIETQIMEKSILIKYYDNAGGINEGLLNKIFEPYFTTKHKSYGTGIGLYMAKQLLIKYLNGDITAFNHLFKIDTYHYKGLMFLINIKK